LRNTILKNLIVYTLVIILVGTSLSALGYCNQQKISSKNTSNNAYEYYNYQDMTDLLHELQDSYSNIMKLESLGQTYEGRDIWMVKLSDNVGVDENEPGVLLMGAHHGNELPSYESLIFFIKHMVVNYSKANTDDDNDGSVNEDPIDGADNDDDGLVDEDPSEDRVRDVIDNTEIFVIPMVNPDGVEANTRKNRAPKEGQTSNIGVDLNRNYGFKWELYDIFPLRYGDLWTSNPESWNYRGECPFSEKESTAVKDFVESEDINISLSYHSYGEFIAYPWTHTSGITPDEDLFLSVGEGISNINGYELYTGKNTLIPWPGGTIGTSENWLYGTEEVLSYTIELCSRRAPTNPYTVYRYCLTHVGVNLYVCERAPSANVEKNVVSRFVSFPWLRVLSFLYKTL